MPRMIVSFMRSRSQSGIIANTDPNFPLPSGYDVRSEYVAIGAASARTVLSALAMDNFVRIQADADCWVKIGDNTVTATALSAAGNNTSMFLGSGQMIDLDIDQGAQVAVIAA